MEGPFDLGRSRVENLLGYALARFILCWSGYLQRRAYVK